MPRQTVSDDVKAAAMADLLAGDQPAIVAQRYRLNPSTVRKWKERAVTEVVTTHGTEVVTTSQRPTYEAQQERIGSLIIQVLEARLRAQLAIAEHVSSNGTWVNKQTASDLASLDGHLHRTAVDVLDRLAGRRTQNTDAEESD